jgi:2-keto-4-pentenoate hydratase/2-oxohepta-3-ene-1,7-dioic acid hydratase in catechol pathway
VIFSKPPTTVTATNTQYFAQYQTHPAIGLGSRTASGNWQKGKYVKKEEALDYVFGYTIINDISARDCRRAGQWIVSKAGYLCANGNDY